MDLNFIKEYLAPERIEQIKGVVVTILAGGGWDIITGAYNNQKIERLSYILDWGEKSFRKSGSLLFKIADKFKWLQEYGNEIRTMDN